MGYAILDNDSIRKDGNICHIYKAEIISNVENAITIKIGELSLCQAIFVEENQREHTFCNNPSTLTANGIGIEKNIIGICFILGMKIILITILDMQKKTILLCYLHL